MLTLRPHSPKCFSQQRDRYCIKATYWPLIGGDIVASTIQEGARRNRVHPANSRPLSRVRSSRAFTVLTMLTCGVLVSWTPLNVYYALVMFISLDNPLMLQIANILNSSQNVLDPVFFILSLKGLRESYVEVYRATVCAILRKKWMVELYPNNDNCALRYWLRFTIFLIKDHSTSRPIRAASTKCECFQHGQTIKTGTATSMRTRYSITMETSWLLQNKRMIDPWAINGNSMQRFHVESMEGPRKFNENTMENSVENDGKSKKIP